MKLECAALYMYIKVLTRIYNLFEQIAPRGGRGGESQSWNWKISYIQIYVQSVQKVLICTCLRSTVIHNSAPDHVFFCLPIDFILSSLTNENIINALENWTFQDLFLETNIYLFYIQNMRSDSMYNNHPNIQRIACRDALHLQI